MIGCVVSKRSVFPVLLALGSCIGVSSAADAVGPAKKTSLVTIPAQMEIGATPERVWSLATSFKGFGALTGFKIADGEGSFTRLGQVVEARVWEDEGLLVVTGFDLGKELRVTWEPKNGNYLCAKRIVLSASGDGTLLEYWDRYTDDQPNADETAKQVREETVKAVAVFESLAK